MRMDHIHGVHVVTAGVLIPIKVPLTDRVHSPHQLVDVLGCRARWIQVHVVVSRWRLRFLTQGYRLLNDTRVTRNRSRDMAAVVVWRLDSFASEHAL